MSSLRYAVGFLAMLALTVPALAGGTKDLGLFDQSAESTPLLAMGGESAGWLAQVGQAAVAAEEEAEAAPPGKPPPWPLHNIEGVGGGLITPTAYLSNPGPKGTVIGRPAVSFTYVYLGSQKSAQNISITETFWRRVEVGYTLSRFDLGTVPDAISKMGFNIRRSDVYLNIFNLRAMLIEENSFGLPTPAVTAGVHFKYNCGVRTIDNNGGKALSSVGFKRSSGIDYTLTASKTVPIVGRPVIFTAGMRNSQAAQLGYLGFGDSCATTVEGSVICLVTDWMGVGYEFRQKENPYHRINNVLGDEDNWHAIFVGFAFNPNFTLGLGCGFFGNLANSEGNCVWGAQLKYEF